MSDDALEGFNQFKCQMTKTTRVKTTKLYLSGNENEQKIRMSISSNSFSQVPAVRNESIRCQFVWDGKSHYQN